jgi:peroxiredoxin
MPSQERAEIRRSLPSVLAMVFVLGSILVAPAVDVLAQEKADQKARQPEAARKLEPTDTLQKAQLKSKRVASLQQAAIGRPAPDFTLTDTEGRSHTLSDYLDQGEIVVLEWFNPDCPFIQKHHLHHKTMNELYNSVRDKGVVWLAINSSAPGKQGYGLEHNREARQKYEMSFPILLDEDGKVGRLYGAKATPHMFVIARDGTLVYSGAIDDDRSPTRLGGTNYVANALQALQARRPVKVASTSPYGCSVKYGGP